MPRMPRVHIEGALYFITSRGDRNQAIFKDDEDYKFYLALCEKYKKHYGFKLFAYNLLQSQLHLLIELNRSVTVSQIMHNLNSSYIKYFNKKYSRSGHLFSERYRCVLIEKNPWLAAATAHIHLDGSVVSWKNDAFSSASAYLNVKNGLIGKEEISEVCALLNGKEYPEFIESLSNEELKTLKSNFSRKNFVGSKEFRQQIEKKLEEKSRQNDLVPKEEKQKFIIYTASGIAVLLVMIVLLVKGYFNLKEQYHYTEHKKKIELERRLREEKEIISKNLKEKYAADQVSFEAMKKRLELEKEKIKELEQKTASN